MSLFDTDAIDASENDDIPRDLAIITKSIMEGPTDQLTSRAMGGNSHLTLIPTEVGEGGRGVGADFGPPTNHLLTAPKVKVLAL